MPRAIPLLLVPWCAMLGCGNDYGRPQSVTGRVTSESQPVPQATVQFTAKEGLPALHRFKIGKTDDDGVYTIDNVYPAEYQVNVIVEGANQPEADPDADPGMLPADGGVTESHPLAKYAGASPLTAVVDADQTTHDFDLEPAR